MKITALRRNVRTGIADPGTPAAIRGTEQQDVRIDDGGVARRRRLVRIGGVAAGALVVLGILVASLNAWMHTSNVVPAERLRIVTVTEGPFVRDVAAQGTVIAAVSPTLFASAPGTVVYEVHAGDTVTKGQVLARIESPELLNEYERERAALDAMSAALARQEIEIRRQILHSRQQEELARVAIQAAERELKRAQWAWDLRAISEREYLAAQDEVETSRLNYEHARDTAALERDSLTLDLRTRRLERDRQALTVRELERKVSELTVRSPVDGMIANLAQNQHALVPESAPILTVVDLSAFEIEFQVAESYAREIKPGMSAEITIDGRRHAGVVTAISPEVRRNEVTGRVKFAEEQPPGLRQNQRASVRIVLDERDRAVKFERGALIDERTRFVYVVRGDRAVRTPVELGSPSVAEIEVLRGLSPGDRVIVSDMRDYRDAPEILIAN
ncbi:MAG: efflux RND transporter periplasmic adaptor subunit [Pseudomonadota bacterium]|jgi:Multidrug resistance efflux pump|nr:MAG: efflux transporter periplasmic adaptor subunit [Pseudomonadota bacterium]